MTKTTKMTLIMDVFIIAAMLPALLGIQYPLVFSYEVHKFLHIIGAILFLGNATVGPVWLIYAIRTKDIKTVRFALHIIGVTDILLSLPGMALLVLNGLCLASVFGGIYAVPWLRHSLILLGIMILLSLTIVLYYQEQLYRVVNTIEELNSQFWRSLWLWSGWGSLVMIFPSIVLYLMVAKRGLW